MILFFVAMTLPYQIGFVETPGLVWTILNYIVDITFAIDMLLTFFTSIFDGEGNLVVDKKKIAKNYLTGWFWIDLISILPIDKMINVDTTKNAQTLQMAKMSRLSRISKFIRLVRIIRMMKMLRLCKDRDRIASRTEDAVKLDENVKRMLTFLVVILFVNHILACLWVFASKFDPEANWVRDKVGNDFAEIDTAELYLMSFYFVSTTVTTVGYGDMSPANSVERVFSIIMLFVGVMCFASLSGSLTSMITQNDNQQASLKQRMDTLTHLRKHYKLESDLVCQLRDSIKFEYSKTVDGLEDFMASLPLQLKYKVAKALHSNVLESFPFFQYANQKSKTFLSWIGHRLVPRQVSYGKLLYE